MNDDRGLYTLYLRTWGKVKSGASVAQQIDAADWQEAAAMALAVSDAQVDGVLRSKDVILQTLQQLLNLDP
jgi:hypothetical protein